MKITAVQKQTVKPSQQTHVDFKMTPGQVGVFFFWFLVLPCNLDMQGIQTKPVISEGLEPHRTTVRPAAEHPRPACLLQAHALREGEVGQVSVTPSNRKLKVHESSFCEGGNKSIFPFTYYRPLTSTHLEDTQKIKRK